MKKSCLLPLFGAVALFGTSCYSDYGTVHTQRGAVVGGLVGAGAGALIGEHNDRELEGAALGGVVGALAGGLLGSARDQEYYGRAYRPVQRTYYRSYPIAPPYPSYSYSYGSYRSYQPHYHSSYRSYPRSYSRSRAPYCR
jgi:hypothetical protein